MDFWLTWGEHRWSTHRFKTSAYSSELRRTWREAVRETSAQTRPDHDTAPERKGCVWLHWQRPDAAVTMTGRDRAGLQGGGASTRARMALTPAGRGSTALAPGCPWELHLPRSNAACAQEEQEDDL